MLSNNRNVLSLGVWEEKITAAQRRTSLVRAGGSAGAVRNAEKPTKKVLISHRLRAGVHARRGV